MLPSLPKITSFDGVSSTTNQLNKEFASFQRNDYLPSIFELIPELIENTYEIKNSRFCESDLKSNGIKNLEMIKTNTSLNYSAQHQRKRRRLSQDDKGNLKFCEINDAQSHETYTSSGHRSSCQQIDNFILDPSPSSRKNNTFISSEICSGSLQSKSNMLNSTSRHEDQSTQPLLQTLDHSKINPSPSYSPPHDKLKEVNGSQIENHHLRNLSIQSLANQFYSSSRLNSTDNEYSFEPELHTPIFQTTQKRSNLYHYLEPNNIFRRQSQTESSSLSITPRVMGSFILDGSIYQASLCENSSQQTNSDIEIYPINNHYLKSNVNVNDSNDNKNINSSIITANLKECKPRKRRGNLPKDTTEKLKTWFLNHLHHPYPNEDEKQQLMESTGLQMNQISNWYINARQRQLPTMTANASAGAEAQRQIKCSFKMSISRKSEETKIS